MAPMSLTSVSSVLLNASKGLCNFRQTFLFVLAAILIGSRLSIGRRFSQLPCQLWQRSVHLTTSIVD
jgi:hypothetical protein